MDLEQMYDSNSRLFTEEKMKDYKYCYEVDMDYDDTVVYFNGLVEHLYIFHESNGSTAEVNGFESATDVKHQRRVDAVIDTRTVKMERVEERNDHLR